LQRRGKYFIQCSADHGHSDGRGHGLRAPNPVAPMTDAGVDLSPARGALGIAGANNAHRRDAHGCAIAHVMRIKLSGQRRQQAAAEIGGGFSFTGAAAIEHVKRDDVLLPCREHVRRFEFSLSGDERAGGEQRKFGVVGSRRRHAFAKIRGDAVKEMIVGGARSIAEGITDREAEQTAGRAIAAQLAVVNEIVARNHVDTLI